MCFAANDGGPDGRGPEIRQRKRQEEAFNHCRKWTDGRSTNTIQQIFVFKKHRLLLPLTTIYYLTKILLPFGGHYVVNDRVLFLLNTYFLVHLRRN